MSRPDGVGTGAPGRVPPAAVAVVALAGLQAVFCLLPGLNGLTLGLSGSVLAFVIGGLYLVLSSATILGAVRMYRRVEARTLAVVSLALCAVWLVNLVLAIVLAGQFDVLSVLLLALAVGVAVGVRRPEVRAWVA